MYFTTLIVVSANTITAVLASALLMLVFWQAPHQRANQYFSLVMLFIAAYSISNGFSRFIDKLNMDPAPVFYLTASFYGASVVAIFFFASEFAQTHTPTVRIMRITGFALIVIQGTLLWTGKVMTNFRPVEGQHGSYTGDYPATGLLTTGTLMAYLLVSAVVLRHMEDERGRSLWPAPVLIICSAISASVIWPIVPIPFNAVFVAASAAVLGRQVLRYELFNPLADLNEQLASKNVELAQASRLKNQFLTNMSHELRTPLNSIIGYTELVVNGTYGEMNDTQRDRLEKVIRNGHNLLGLINDVLDLNKIETGRIVLDRKTVNARALLDQVLTTIEPMAARKGLSTTRQYEHVPVVMADEARVRQIVTNILANAVKFTHQGGITVRAFRNGEMAQFEISDTGIGIQRELFDAVFAEFQQLDNSPTRQYEGTGLGMAITKKLVELHGGKIWLDSTPGKGSTFFFTLPAELVKQPSAPAGPVLTRESDLVLVIDDMPDALEMMADILTNAGYRVATAASGAEGITRARQLQPDLITLDVMMPGIDGWQVLRALKDEPRTRHIPVVIVSVINNRPLAMSLGAQDSLAKPFDTARLVKALDDTLAQVRKDQPILLIDDNPDECAMVIEALGRKGHSIICSGGGPKGLEWLKENTPSLILLDLMMPEVSGFDVLAYVRGEERLAQVPVIVMTAKDLTDEERDFLRTRCDDLVQKGFGGPEVLLRTVQKVLRDSPVAGGKTVAEKA